MIQMSDELARSLVNAISLPCGEKAGIMFWPGPFVSCRLWKPLRFMIQISMEPLCALVYTILFPAGDHAGVPL